MGAVVSCLAAPFRALGDCLRVIVNSVGSVLHTIISAIVSVCNTIISFLTCGYVGRRRVRGTRTVGRTRMRRTHRRRPAARVI